MANTWLKKSVLVGAAGLFLAACGNNANSTSGGDNGGAKASGGDAKAFTLYSNKSEIQEALTAYAKEWGDKNGVNVTIKTCSGACKISDQLKTEFTAGTAPDVFVIEGQAGYDMWKDNLQPIKGDWVDKTEFEFKQGSDVYGFPVSVEGYGLAYNKEVLDKAGIDPNSLTSFDAVKKAMETLESKKDELGLTTVVATATKEGETWIMGIHDFGAYLSSGLPNGDRTVTNQVVKGEMDKTRLDNYANWVELLFDHTEKKMLTVGTQEDMDSAFASGKAAFLHQGNWKDPNLKQLNANFDMGFIPYQTLGTDKNADGLFIGAPSYYVVNKDTKALDSINKFFEDLADSKEGQDYTVNKANMISAFSTTTEKPSAPLSRYLAEWIAAKKPVYSFDNPYFMPDNFLMNKLGPIYGQYAAGSIDKAKFEDLITNQIKEIPSLLNN